MPQYSFGSGNLYGIPSGTNPTPQLFGTLQDATIDITFTTKKLYGQYQFPVAIGRGEATLMGKAKAASISSRAFNSLFTGLSDAAGSTLVANNEAFSPAAGSYTVTNHTTFSQDLGVTYASSGISLVNVASAPTVGQYSYVAATGVYTFNTGDNGIAMYVSYSYTSPTVGRSLTYTNQLMGSSALFQVVFNIPYPTLGTAITFIIYQCISSKLSMDFKNTDFTIPEFDLEAFANPAGQVYQLSTTD